MLGRQRLVARAAADTPAEAGTAVAVSVEGGRLHLFAEEGGQRLIGACPA